LNPIPSLFIPINAIPAAFHNRIASSILGVAKMEILIRKAKPDDAPGLGEILRSVDWFTALMELPLENLEAQIVQGLDACAQDDSHSLWVAETAAGRLVGYLSVHWLPYLFLDGPEGYISELFIHKGARSVGIGTMLLDKVKEEARGRGCARLMLVNGRTRESYQREFYKKNGWRERETMANFVLDLK
jgi:GNAT superfamily N-acetyltransferase